MTDLTQAEIIHDILRAEESNNLTLPKWVTSEIYQELHEVAIAADYWDYSSRKIQALRAGQLIAKIYSSMVSEAEGRDEPKMHIYSTVRL